MKRFARKLAAASVAVALASPAFAVLQRVGPADPAHGYPQWYQDANGLALEICMPTTQADLTAGVCAILPGPPPDGLTTVPEVFPTNWSMEHWYYMLTSKTVTAGVDKRTGLPTAGAGNLILVNGLEASFNTPTPEAGQQITFNRWRVIHLSPACSGDHTYYTPHRAPKKIPVVAGVVTQDTEDIGIGPDFNGAMTGSVGPFLFKADVPGGNPLPYATGADGKKYLSLGDLGPVTGSVQPNPFQGSTLAYIPPEIRAMPMTNYVMVVGPGVQSGNCAVTEAAYAINDLSVLGRVNANAIASRTNIDRATYRAVFSNNTLPAPDRFQIGAWANAVQEVGRPEPIVALSLNKGDPADVVNSTPELAMLKAPVVTAGPALPGQVATPRFNFFNGVIQPTVAGQPGPAFNHARVRTTTDAPPTVVNVPLVDELRITTASYNNNTKVLTVTADSGAFLAAGTPAGQLATNALCSNPCLTLDSFGLPARDAAGALIDFKMKVAAASKTPVATVTIPNVQVPPAYVTVRSSALGVDTAQVMYLGAAAGTASFQPDTASTFMNVPVTIDVLANDVGVAAVPNLLVCTLPTGGTCAVPNPAATCTVGTATANCTAQGGKMVVANGMITYSPRANFGGATDTFYYQAATVLGTTQRQRVDVNIGAINGLPDARDDLGNTGVVNQPLSMDVLANDFAPGGVNLNTLRLTTQPFNTVTGAVATGSAVFLNGRLVFTAPSAGTWNMAYTFNSNAGTTADQAVVAVNAIGAETLTVQRALWRAGRAPALGTVAVNGTSNIAQGQQLQLRVPAAGTVGCNAPTQGQQIGVLNVGAGGAFDFGAIALATRPAAVYVYSPTFGGCAQVNVQ